MPSTTSSAPSAFLSVLRLAWTGRAAVAGTVNYPTVFFAGEADETTVGPGRFASWYGP